MTGVLTRRCEDTGRMPCKDREKTEVVLPQAKECLGLPGAGKGKEGSSLRGLKGRMALITP